jgi:hypothetical protein
MNRNIKTIAALIVAGTLLLQGCSSSRVAVHKHWLSQPSHRIAVFPMAGDEPYGEAVAEALITELVNTGFPVIERRALKQILRELSLQTSGAVDAYNAVESGRLMGADFIVIGSVTTRPFTPPMDWLFGDGHYSYQIDRVNLRWVSVRNGQVMASSSFRNVWGGNPEFVAKKISRSFNNKIQMLTHAGPKSNNYE